MSSPAVCWPLACAACREETASVALRPEFSAMILGTICSANEHVAHTGQAGAKSKMKTCIQCMRQCQMQCMCTLQRLCAFVQFMHCSHLLLCTSKMNMLQIGAEKRNCRTWAHVNNPEIWPEACHIAITTFCVVTAAWLQPSLPAMLVWAHTGG